MAEKKQVGSTALVFTSDTILRGVSEEAIFEGLKKEAEYQGLTVSKFIKVILAERLKDGQNTTGANGSIFIPSVYTSDEGERKD